MTITREITAFDIVELTVRVGTAPAGARGGVLELRGDGIAMIEITEPPLDAAARIVFVSLDELRVVNPT